MTLVKISLKLQALHFAMGYEMQSLKITKSINDLKNLSHTIFKCTCLEPYLRFLETLS